MLDVDYAIDDIVEALDEYGSAVTLRNIVSGAYDPLTGSSTTTTDYPTKAFINKLASESIQGQIRLNEAYSGYEMSITLYSSHAIDSTWRVLFNSVEYKIILVVPYTLQNTIFKYEILVKR